MSTLTAMSSHSKPTAAETSSPTTPTQAFPLPPLRPNQPSIAPSTLDVFAKSFKNKVFIPSNT